MAAFRLAQRARLSQGLLDHPPGTMVAIVGVLEGAAGYLVEVEDVAREGEPRALTVEADALEPLLYA